MKKLLFLLPLLVLVLSCSSNSSSEENVREETSVVSRRMYGRNGGSSSIFLMFENGVTGHMYISSDNIWFDNVPQGFFVEPGDTVTFYKDGDGEIHISDVKWRKDTVVQHESDSEWW